MLLVYIFIRQQNACLLSVNGTLMKADCTQEGTMIDWNELTYFHGRPAKFGHTAPDAH